MITVFCSGMCIGLIIAIILLYAALLLDEAGNEFGFKCMVFIYSLSVIICILLALKGWIS